MVAINLALIDGDYFADEHVDAIEAAINISDPAGRIEMYCGATAPTGWLLLNGASIANANTTYPDLWAVVPASWKSGTTLNLPNFANRFAIGLGTTALGATGGANSRTIATGNLPAHDHTFSGTTSGTVDAEIPGGQYVRLSGAPTSVIGSGAVGIDTPDANAVAHTHTYSGTTSSVGSGTALDVTPAHLAVSFIIRSY